MNHQPTILAGDCLQIMPTLAAESVDAIVTDPPYGLSNTDTDHVVEALTHWLAGDRTFVPHVGGGGFMGKDWDSFVPPPAAWDECLRVLKPGGHLLSFAGTRTIGLMETAIRLAGFEIRPAIAWLFASGFPKSLDVSKAIDKAAGAEREVIGETVRPYTAPKEGMMTRKGRAESGYRPDGAPSVMERANADGYAVTPITAPATPEAARWQGWGTALKPAFEPIVVARKPFPGTVAANVLKHGTGALNIDATRIDFRSEADQASAKPGGLATSRNGALAGKTGPERTMPGRTTFQPRKADGRWPANVVLDEDQAAALDQQSGYQKTGTAGPRSGGFQSEYVNGRRKPGTSSFPQSPFEDGGGASRFYFCAKAPKRERPIVDGKGHPTVKPLTLMRWLCRLVTPPGGIILDPFAGSGATIQAGMLEGFRVIGIESDPHSVALIRQRLSQMPDDALPFDDDGEVVA